MSIEKNISKTGPEDDRNIENSMGTLLRAGVISAATLVSIGAIFYLFKYGAQIPDYSAFKGESEKFSTLAGIYKSLFSLSSRGIIMSGLIVLILTPIVRVLFSLIAFTLKKDFTYTLISAVVLIILLLSFFEII